TLKNFSHGGSGHTKSLPSFFSLLFPFFSLFSSLFFFPPFSFLPPSWCASVPQLFDYLEQDRSGLVGQSSPFKSILSNPIQPWNENGPAPIAALLSIVENLCDVTLPSYADASSSRWLKLRQLVKVSKEGTMTCFYFSLRRTHVSFPYCL